MRDTLHITCSVSGLYSLPSTKTQILDLSVTSEASSIHYCTKSQPMLNKSTVLSVM